MDPNQQVPPQAPLPDTQIPPEVPDWQRQAVAGALGQPQQTVENQPMPFPTNPPGQPAPVVGGVDPNGATFQPTMPVSDGYQQGPPKILLVISLSCLTLAGILAIIYFL